MSILQTEQLSMTHGDKVLFTSLSFSIDGQKIGLIGRNGTGKSTLMRILAGLESPTTGTIRKSERTVIGYLPQDPEINHEATVLEQVFLTDSREMDLIRSYEEVSSRLEKAPQDPKLQKSFSTLNHEMETANAWDLERQIKTILTKLGIDDFEKKMGSLSGGQQKRVFLAAALVNPCHLLLLDEPTNHLDSDTIQWLEEYLNQRKGALMMITHDRYFLDRVTDTIYELEEGSLYQYQGNYDMYLSLRSQRLDQAKSTEEKLARLLKKEQEWMKKGAKARTTKQKARIQRFHELEDLVQDQTPAELAFESHHQRLGKKIIELLNITKTYNEISCFNPFSYNVQRQDRIGIIGKNGSGKTTLLNIMAGLIQQDQGTIEWGETVKIGYFAQTLPKMDESLRAIDYLKQKAEYIKTADGSSLSISDFMERFLFRSSEQYTLVQKLSGGERRRLYLLEVLISGPNVLLLDEPTNDLDIPTLQALEDYLETFPGPVIAVSHDRYFLDRIANKVFSFQENGTINLHTGNYFDYLEEIKKDSVVVENSTVDLKKSWREESTPRKKKRTFKEQKEFETIFEEINQLELRLEELNQFQKDFSTDFVRLQEIHNEIQQTEEILLEKMEREEYLSSFDES